MVMQELEGGKNEKGELELELHSQAILCGPWVALGLLSGTGKAWSRGG